MSITLERPESAVEPARTQPKTERFNLRATADEAAIIRQAAAARRQSVTEFLIESALTAANHALSEDRRQVLANAVFDRIAEELAEEPKTIEALAALLKRPRKVQLPE